MTPLDRDMARAVALAQSGKTKAAIAVFEKVVKAAPAALEPRYNLALLLLGEGRAAPALVHLDRLLTAYPSHPAVAYSTARGLMALGRAEEALPLLRPLAATGDPDSLLALGNVLRTLGRAAEAAEVYRTLTERAPAMVGGHVNLGLLLVAGDPERAVRHLELATRLHPANAELQALLGQALLRLGRIETAIDRLNQALRLDPGLDPARGHLLRAYRESADWEREEALFAEIRDRLGRPARGDGLMVSTQDALFFPFSGAEMRRVAAAEAAFRVPASTKPPARPAGANRAAGPLTIAYLSPDYRDHATMHLAGDLFASHDRDAVRVVCASIGPDDGSSWRGRVQATADLFLDLAGGSDRAAATRLAAEGIDILVDLSVFTRHARPGIAALRPAPIQIAWLGLAASSAAPWIDYAMVDPVLVPPAHRDHFSEALIFLPHGYQVNLAWTAPAAPPPRRSLGLPETAVVYCSFNGHRKLDRHSFALWLRVLAAVPDAVLWQLAPPEPARSRLEQTARAAGIDPARLIWAPRLPRGEHLARLPAADVFLDALICGAHTTAADALRMGVPVLTCPGSRLAARVAGSLAHSLGLDHDLTATDPAALERRAIALGRDAAARAALRGALAAALPTAICFNPKLFARDLEAAYQQAWNRHRAGKRPADMTINALNS